MRPILLTVGIITTSYATKKRCAMSKITRRQAITVGVVAASGATVLIGGASRGLAADLPKGDTVKVEVEGLLGTIIRQENTDWVTATVLAGQGEFVIDASGSKAAQNDLVRLANKYIKHGSTVIILPRLKVTGRLEFRVTKVVGEKGEMSDGSKVWVLVADSVAESEVPGK